MAIIQKFVPVIQRQLLTIESNEAYLLPLLEPLLLIETHMALEERLKLFGLGMSMRPGFVACEVGSYFGASTCLLAAAASFRQGHVHAVDTWKNDSMQQEPIEDTWERFVRNTARYDLWITAHRGLAHEMKDGVPEINLLFIDGDHSYEGTLAHLSDYAPKIISGGFVAMHDFPVETVEAACRDYFKDREPADLGLTNSLKLYRLP